MKGLFYVLNGIGMGPLPDLTQLPALTLELAQNQQRLPTLTACEPGEKVFSPARKLDIIC